MPLEMFVALRLCREGFGSPEVILATPAPIVLGMLNFSTFLADYQETFSEINRDHR